MTTEKRINVIISEGAWLKARMASIKEKFPMERTLGAILEKEISQRWGEESMMIDTLVNHLNVLSVKGFNWVKFSDLPLVEINSEEIKAEEDTREYRLTYHEAGVASLEVQDDPNAGAMVYDSLARAYEETLNKYEGDNIWEDEIYYLLGVKDESFENSKNPASDYVWFVDGSTLFYDTGAGEWVVG